MLRRTLLLLPVTSMVNPKIAVAQLQLLPMLFAGVCRVLVQMKIASFIQSAATEVLLDSISDAVRGESRELQKSQNDIELVMAEHFRSGLDQLLIARNSTTATRRENSLIKARDKFISAKNVEKLPANSARATVYIGSCSDMLGEASSALYYYEMAYKEFDHRQHIILSEGRSPVLTRAANYLACKSFQIRKTTRRQLLDQVTSTYKIAPSLRMDLDLVRVQMTSLSEVLHVRKSHLPILVSPKALSPDSVAEQAVRTAEITCGFKLP